MHITKITAICIAIFLLVLSLGAYWSQIGQSLNRNEQRFYMSELVNAQASAIERRLARSLSATRILAQGVRQHHGVMPQFETYADEVLKAVGGVSNLQLAPDGIIRYIHPIEGNEKAMGHNILKDDHRLKEAMLAINEHRLTLAGPFTLVQGGVAVIGRNPVFLAHGEGEKFWGFTSALIYLADLLKVTELDSLQGRGYSYQLRRSDPDTGIAEIFARSTSELTDDAYSVSINVPNATWQLVISRAKNLPQWRSSIGYIISFFAALLIASITRYILLQPEKLRKEVKEKTQELQQLAYYDHLTGLANRRYLNEQLIIVFKEYSRNQKPAVLMYLDLDDFKKINDSMGHAAGDVLLQQIAIRLKKCVRSNDLVTRLGGDEFSILLLDTDSTRNVSRIAEKLIAIVHEPVILEGKSFAVSTSVGITMIPADGHDANSILRNADMAMYAAKTAGKTAGKQRFSFYNESLQAIAIAKLQLEDDLAVAINEKQFALHYQPILTLQTDEANGYEALIRWKHPEQGLLYPDKFIGIAEETGKIIDIGYWIISEVCHQITLRTSKLQPHHRFSINLSPKQFKDPHLLDNIRHIMQETKVDGGSLEFEVTESCVMEDVENASNTLLQLKEMGISVAIDDFGTGYSSFALLKHLPVDKLKIDKSFINDLETNISDQKIVHGLISMAHKLHLEVVAEGIETKEQHLLLKKYKCDLGQGYLFSKPVSLDNLEGFVYKRV